MKIFVSSAQILRERKKRKNFGENPCAFQENVVSYCNQRATRAGLSRNIFPMWGVLERMFSMSPLMIVLTVVYVIFCLFLIAVVLLQSGKSAGLAGAISGGVDTFLSKNKAKTWDSRLAKMTKWVAILFMVLTLVLVLFM